MPVEMPEIRVPQAHNNANCCRNCSAPLTGRYCSQCGQDAAKHVASLRQLIGDFFGDYFTFDSRLIRSLKPLVLRPGQLTNEYLAGRRARYIPPLRLYLFISIGFFFLLSLMSLRPDWFSVHRPPGFGSSTPIELSAKVKAKLAHKPAWEQRMVRNSLAIKSNPRAFFSDAIRKLPTMMFVLLPLFALLLKLLYLRRRRYYVEHLVFSCHYHALVFLTSIFFLVVYAVAEHTDLRIVKNNLGAVIWGYLTLYLVLAMRRVYGQGWLKTLIKLGMLASVYGIALMCAFLATLTWTLID